MGGWRWRLLTFQYFPCCAHALIGRRRDSGYWPKTWPIPIPPFPCARSCSVNVRRVAAGCIRRTHPGFAYAHGNRSHRRSRFKPVAIPKRKLAHFRGAADRQRREPRGRDDESRRQPDGLSNGDSALHTEPCSYQNSARQALNALGTGMAALDFIKTLTIAASGLRAQAGRMRIISENIANADSTPQRPGADPYRRKIPTFRSELDRTLDTQLVELERFRQTARLFASNTSRGTHLPTAMAMSNTRTSTH